MRHSRPVRSEAHTSGQDSFPSSNEPARGPLYLNPAVVVEDDGIDLIGAVLTLTRGWKILVAVMVVAGIVGLAVVSRTPGRHRANAVLRIDDPSGFGQFTPQGKMPAAQEGIELLVLKRYASSFLTETNLREAIEEAGLSSPGETDDKLKQLRTAVTAVPLKDSSTIQVSVTWDDAAEAERILRAVVDRGLKSLETARRREIDTTGQRLHDERDETLTEFRDKQRQVEDVRREQKVKENQARLQVLQRQLTTAQQLVSSNQTRIDELEARIEAALELIETTPTTKKMAYCLNQLPEFCGRLASKLNVSPQAIAELEIELETANSVHGWLQRSLAQDQVALRGAQRVVQQNRPAAQSTLQQIVTLQSELTGELAKLKLIERELKEAQDAYLAAEVLLGQWKGQSEVLFPALKRDDPSHVSVQAMTLHPLSRLLLSQIGAFTLGCIAVFFRSAYRNRVARERRADADVLPGPSATAGSSPSHQRRVPA